MEEYVLVFERKKKECGCRLYYGTAPLKIDRADRIVECNEEKGDKLVTVLEVVDVISLDKFADMRYEENLKNE